METACLAVKALPGHLRPRCGASRYEQTEALLVGLRLLRVDDVGAKEKQPRKRAGKSGPYDRPKGASAEGGAFPGRRERGYAAVEPQPGVYNPQLAENELGTAFLTYGGLRRHRVDAVAITRLLLLNIPDMVPTEPHSLRYPMLTRLRTLLEDRQLCKDAQAVINATGADGPARSTADMRLVWMAFSPPASKRGHLDRVMELVVLLYRAKEVFSPIEGDPTNDLRFRTWHRMPPEDWNGFDDSAHTFEYAWFHRLSAHLYVRLLRNFSSGHMLQNYATTVKWVHELARRPVGSADWAP